VFVKRFDAKIFTNVILKAKHPVIRGIILNGRDVIELVVGIEFKFTLPIVRFWNFNTLTAVHRLGFLSLG